MPESVFEELAYGCKMGDPQAMLGMYQWFWSQVSDELKRLDSQYAARGSEESEKELEERLEQKPQEGFKLRAAYTWLARAAFYGSQAAMDLLERHPRCVYQGVFPVESLFWGSGEHSVTVITGETLRALGLTEIKARGEISLWGQTEERNYYYETYAGYEGADEDGYGMEEEYNYYMYDEFFRHVYTFQGYSRREFESLRSKARDYRQALERLERERKAYWQNREGGQRAEKVRTRQRGMLIKDGILYRCLREESEVCQVPRGVHRIWPGAFQGMEKAAVIQLPDSVTEVGEGAFESCRNLITLILPEGLREIPEGMCRDCSGLRSISLPGTVTKIGSQAFYGCTKLEHIAFPEGLRQISGEAFKFCENLREIDLPDSVETLEEKAFCYCKALEKVRMPGKFRNMSREEQGRYFYGCPVAERTV